MLLNSVCITFALKSWSNLVYLTKSSLKSQVDTPQLNIGGAVKSHVKDTKWCEELIIFSIYHNCKLGIFNGYVIDIWILHLFNRNLIEPLLCNFNKFVAISCVFACISNNGLYKKNSAYTFCPLVCMISYLFLCS